MRIAYLDCFSGISGDMFLGALVDAGVSPQLLEQTVAALDIGARLDISRVTRSGISATKVDVFVHGEKDEPREVHLAKKHKSKHHHHPDAKTHAHRHLEHIRQIIDRSSISPSAKTTALRIFQSLAEAEAKIHNCSIDQVHFHEVGAVDAIVDIVCAAVGTEALAVDQIIASPLNVGGGTVKCAHGILPVPAPATLELLKDAPVYSSGVQAELVTPTGAAIIKTLAAGFAPFPAMAIDRAGYGAGSRDFPDQPNVLRLTIGEAPAAGTTPSSHEAIAVLEANLDDLNPQIIGYVTEQLLERGALDVFTVPAQMKKNRPGTLLTALCRPEDAPTLTDLIFRETTTLGVRRREEHRQVLDRRWESVPTPWGSVRIKIAGVNGVVSNAVPEYEDCRRIATDNNIPLKTVINQALEAFGRVAVPSPAIKNKKRKSS